MLFFKNKYVISRALVNMLTALTTSGLTKMLTLMFRKKSFWDFIYKALNLRKVFCNFIKEISYMECRLTWPISHSTSYFYFYRVHLFNIKRSSRENKWQILLQTSFDPASVRLPWQITVAVNNRVNCKPSSVSKSQVVISRGKKSSTVTLH